LTLEGMDKGLAGVIRGQLLICLVNGVLTYIGLVIFGIKYSFLLALVAGVFSLIPIFGTIASSIPIVLIGLVSGEQGVSLGPAVGILGWIAGIHLLEANVLNPKIIGEAAKNLSAEFRDKHPDIPWKRMAGMRDRVIHAYFGVDADLVWEVVEKHVPELKSRIESLLELPPA